MEVPDLRATLPNRVTPSVIGAPPGPAVAAPQPVSAHALEQSSCQMHVNPAGILGAARMSMACNAIRNSPRRSDLRPAARPGSSCHLPKVTLCPAPHIAIS
jgi:hypothetical protein